MSIRNQICKLAFSLQMSQIWRFSRRFSENYHLALKGEKHLATVFVMSSKFRK